MSDMIQGPPRTVREMQGMRTVRGVKMDEERSDEDRHLAELEERMRNARKRKRKAGMKAAPRPQRTEDGHIDFTA